MSGGEDARFATKAIHAGQDPTQWVHGAVIPPIVMSTTYNQPSPANPLLGYEYSRSGNPTRDCLQAALAAVEGAKYGLTFSSGLSATLSIIQALVKSGEHIVSCEDCYGGTGRLFRTCASRFGITTTFVDGRFTEEFQKAVIVGKTRMVWVETPTNPCLSLTDIEAVGKAIKALDPKIVYVVDNTFMSSYLQQPLKLGADIVMHSLTKYMNGHSDVIMGAIMTNNEDYHRELKYVQNAIGTVPSPMDCFLVNRGLKTLHLRMDAHSSNALAVAKFLETHPKVQSVIYPGLESHPQHELAKKQTPRGFSGMVSLYVKSKKSDAASKVVSSLKIFTLAESLGGIESLSEIPALMTHASHPEEVRSRLGIDDSLIRLSVGVEDVDDLIKDLQQALDQV